MLFQPWESTYVRAPGLMGRPGCWTSSTSSMVQDAVMDVSSAARAVSVPEDAVAAIGAPWTSGCCRIFASRAQDITASMDAGEVEKRLASRKEAATSRRV